jgi:hypothetical protein
MPPFPISGCRSSGAFPSKQADVELLISSSSEDLVEYEPAHSTERTGTTCRAQGLIVTILFFSHGSLFEKADSDHNRPIVPCDDACIGFKGSHERQR